MTKPAPTKNKYTQHTWDLLQADDWECFDVEERKGRLKFDCLGFGDILAVKPGALMLVQSTDASHHGNRRRKIIEERRVLAEAWLMGGGLIEVISWTVKEDPNDSKAQLWIPRVEAITEEHFI